MKKPTFCGIDIGLKKHAVCLLDSTGSVIAEFEIHNNREGFTRLAKQLGRKTKIAVEPTGVYGINLYLYLGKKSHDIRFVEPRSSNHFRKARNRYKKADKKDALALAKYRIVNEDLTRSGTRYFERLLKGSKTLEQRQLMGILAEHRSLTRDLMRTKQRIKTLVDLRFPEAGTLYANRGCKSVCRALCNSRAEILKGKVPGLPQKLVEQVRDTIGQYDLHLDRFKELAHHQESLEKDLARLQEGIKAFIHSLGYSTLLGQPCIGPIGAATLITEALPLHRFTYRKPSGKLDKKGSLRAFKTYCGLGTTQDQSGEHDGKPHLSKAGNRALKSTLYASALTFLSMKETRIALYDECPIRPRKYRAIFKEYKGRGQKGLQAMVKMMDKLATDLFFLLLELERESESRVVPEMTRSTACTGQQRQARPELQTTSP